MLLCIAKELIERGEVNRLAILCPPHLAEQVVEISEIVMLRDAFGHQRLRESIYTPGQIDRRWSDDIEADFIFDAIEFVAAQGRHFLPLYDFDMHTGAWLHKADCGCMEGFSLERALECRGYQSRTLSCGERSMLYSAYLGEAQRLADELAAHQQPLQHDDDVELEALKFFSVPEASCVKRTA